MLIAPERETAERAALLGMTSSWGSTSHFNVLLDCQQMFIIAASHKQDTEAIKMGQAANVALANIRDRYLRTKRIGVDSSERAMLSAFIDYAADWWKRQSGTLFIDAEASIKKLRDQQKTMNITVAAGA